MKWLLIFATAREAAATIRALSAVRTADNRYSFSGGALLLCGMGLEASARSAALAPAEGFRWMNVGVAGSLDSRLSVGTFQSVGSVGLLGGKDPILIDPQGEALLLSSPTPIHAPPKGVQKALIDMEGYSLAQAALERKVPLMVRKVVSDYCSPTSSADILANIDWLSKCMAEEIVNTLRLETTPKASSS